ncbi:hypothetical protein Back11_17950 [Paenibacillus baekrokdamisoli]|uniref:Uncharacterized protein n=1 Tax=Paenibacillus baekrokdamisoli TaxID=1712516 RepID=A0A3G9INM5_9BACL|nr:hypothetical protein [Paenibacillus baekrokdamisoli]MBB3073512.1 hypothetical protein [Paenibacillus baekrokdamisoli]BBH20450.1 hypothetical protein Back11_17950 [Paenibacillus baekrokdamisoli]
MIRKKFKQWADSNIEELRIVNISTEFVKHNNIDESRVPNPSTGIIHESESCLGQVIVWESHQMEYEVVNIETEEMILWKYIEKIAGEPNFDDILNEYFQVLQSGLKP